MNEARAPSLALLALEARALPELALFLQAQPLLRQAPRGDGHGVLVLPGFTASDASTRPLRRYLERQGYSVHGWSLGANRGPTPGLEVAMMRRLEQVWIETRSKVSLVGWSLGGIYARELAKRRPDLVRCVVTLGSPFAASPRSTNVWRLFEGVSGRSVSDIEKHQLAGLRQPPPVPSTAVYSTSDGVAAWQGCVDTTEGPHTENVRVAGSHCGLGHNPQAVWVIANRLAQAEGEWQRFDRGGWASLVFPPPAHGTKRAA
jgi:pimeloyl-ACP methyl ester carboxylesterase